jgi:GT2 family glycosyltransferase
MSRDIDIVIPCAGRSADLLRLLKSLHDHCAESLQHRVASVTVTDDRPSAELAAAVAREFPQVRYVHGPARGPAVNRNHGAGLGQAPWLLFLDDDCYLQSDLLQAYASRRAQHPAADVLEGAIHAVGPRPNGNHHAPLNTTGGFLWSCNIMVRRAVFEAVGRFDEDYPFACMEDCDLHLRLRAAQVGLVFAADAVVLHPWRSISERELTRQIISHAIYATKHPSAVADWTLLHLGRLLVGRWRLYRQHRQQPIPAARYRTVGYDLVTPVALFAVVRVPVLRRALWTRHRNLPALGA